MVTAAMDIEAVMVMDTVAATAMAADLQRAAVAVSVLEHGVAAVVVNSNSLFRIDTERLHLPVKVAPLKTEQL
jgi:3-dehydroquinate synthase class II